MDKSKRVNLRLTEGQYEYFKKRAVAQKMTLTDTIIFGALNGEVEPELRKIQDEIIITEKYRAKTKLTKTKSFMLYCDRNVLRRIFYSVQTSIALTGHPNMKEVKSIIKDFNSLILFMPEDLKEIKENAITEINCLVDEDYLLKKMKMTTFNLDRPEEAMKRLKAQEEQRK